MTEELENQPSKVLVVDDETGLRDMLSYGLQKRGFHVTGASNGESALALAQKQTFDLAICDIMMPGMDGVEVLKQLKILQPDIEVVMATGYATLESAVETMKSGAFDYITKPYSLSHLCTIFEKAQDHKRLKAKVGYLEELNRLKSEFMATMSHELRTPLASMLGYISLLLKEIYGPLQSKQENVLQRVEINGRNLLQLINNILDLSKLSAHRMTLDPEQFEVCELLKDIGEAIEPLATAKKLTLVFDCRPGLWVMADKTKLKQVLINLIGNSIKFTKEGSVTITVQGLEGSFLEIAVRDTGIGIAEDDISQLFQEFKQLDSSTTRNYGGTGLGLSISKKIIELMGGTISVESVKAKGSCFRITFPGYIPPPQDVPKPLASLLPVGETSNEKTILAIDDDPDVLQVLKDGLTGTGFRFVSANTGEQGVALARQLKPDLITLDIMMSHMDGWSVLQVFKNDPVLRIIPIYIVSVVDNKPLAYSLGVTGYILKPFTRDELLDKLKLVPKTRAQQVLVVDDDPQVRALFVEFLSTEGYDVEAIASGTEAIDRMKRLKPDILFLDLVMPGMSGFDVLEAMDQIKDRAMAFVITDKELTQEEKHFLDRRVQMVLKKHPTHLIELLPAIKEKLKTLNKVNG